MLKRTSCHKIKKINFSGIDVNLRLGISLATTECFMLRTSKEKINDTNKTTS